MRNFLKIVQILLFLTILGLPLYIVRWDYFSIPTTLLENLIVATFIALVVYLVTNQREAGLEPLRVLREPLFYLISLFILSAVISVWLSPDQRAGLGVFKAFIVEPLLLFLVVSFLIKRGVDYQKNILLPLVLSSLWLCLIAVWQAITHTDNFAPLEIEQGRVTSVYNNPNFLGLYLGPILGLISGQLFVSKKAFTSTFLYTTAFLVILFTIFLTKSNGAVLGVAGVLLVFVFYHLSSRVKGIFKKLLGYSAVALVTSVVSALLFLMVNISEFTPNYGLTYPRPRNDTKIIRLCLWEGTLNLLKEQPLFGVGLGGFPLIYEKNRTCDTEIFRYPHNLFLNFWAEMGLLGMTSFLGIIFYLLREVFKHLSKNPRLALGLLGAMVYIFIHGISDVPYLKNDLSAQFWLLVGLAMALKEKDH